MPIYKHYEWVTTEMSSTCVASGATVGVERGTVDNKRAYEVIGNNDLMPQLEIALLLQRSLFRTFIVLCVAVWQRTCGGHALGSQL